MNKSELFQAMGLGPVWELRNHASEQPVFQQMDGGTSAPQQVSEPSETIDLGVLAQQVAQCRACGLCQTRTQTVFADGVPGSPLMVVGEAPGADEDQQGFPFVGRTGQLLDKMLHAVGMNRRSNVYIANVLKCRPPGNRNPEASEIEQCAPFLLKQIQASQPKVLFLVGRFAINALLKTEKPISQLRGAVHQIELNCLQIPAVVSYHPAYLLRRPEEKSKSWDDLLLLSRTLSSMA